MASSAPSSMKALVKEQPGPSYEYKDVPVPAPTGDELLVRVGKVGLCGSDINYYKWNSCECVYVCVCVCSPNARNFPFCPVAPERDGDCGIGMEPRVREWSGTETSDKCVCVCVSHSIEKHKCCSCCCELSLLFCAIACACPFLQLPRQSQRLRSLQAMRWLERYVHCACNSSQGIF